jgi:hypothetical protein
LNKILNAETREGRGKPSHFNKFGLYSFTKPATTPQVQLRSWLREKAWEEQFYAPGENIYSSDTYGIK